MEIICKSQLREKQGYKKESVPLVEQSRALSLLVKAGQTLYPIWGMHSQKTILQGSECIGNTRQECY